MTEPKKKEEVKLPPGMNALLKIEIQDTIHGMSIHIEKAGMSEIQMIGHLEYIKASVVETLLNKSVVAPLKAPTTLDGQPLDYEKPLSKDEKETLN